MSDPNPAEWSRGTRDRDYELRPDLRDAGEWSIAGLDALAEFLDAQAANPFTPDAEQEQNHHG